MAKKQTLHEKILAADSEKAALTALRSLGFVRSRMSLTRGAKTYHHPEVPHYMVSTSPHAFIMTGSGWSFMSASLHIENLREKAHENAEQLLQLAGMLCGFDTRQPVPTHWGLCLAFAAGALADARARAARAQHAVG